MVAVLLPGMEQTNLPSQDNRPLTKKEKRALRRVEHNQQISSLRVKKSFGRVIFWIVLLAVIGGSVFGIIKLAGKTPTVTQSGEIPAITASDHVTGLATSPIALVEYSDFQCPACGAYYPLIKQLVQEFGDRIGFAFRNFPLYGLHPNAELASQAAEAASAQNRFWEMHDLLFENQPKWANLPNPRETFYSYATEIGLNLEQFKNDLTSTPVKDKVKADVTGGTIAGVNGTPSFFLNGARIQNPRNYDEFKSILTAALGANS